MISVDNTATSWHKFLESLAQEAQRDADATDERFALHGILVDLANVSRAYAGRLEVERGVDLRQSADGEDPAIGLAPDPIAATHTAAPVSPAETQDRLPENQLPDWLMQAIGDMGSRIEELELRVSQLEATPRSFVPISDPHQLDLIDVLDEDRMSWNSVDRARNALRGMVQREHRRLSASRQSILSRLAAVALDREDPLIAAELRQHRDRAQELANIDAILGVKLDEIAACDDLLVLREYDPLKGWPV